MVIGKYKDKKNKTGGITYPEGSATPGETGLFQCFS
jgi:hypothetical protein